MARFEPSERLLYSSADVRVGTFCCPVGHPEFATAGPIEGYTVAFPRSAVWIEHADRPPFVADPGIATVYNRGQPYVRRRLAPDGDRVEWFSVSQRLALTLMLELAPDLVRDSARPFPVAFARVTTGVYYQQRLLFNRIRRGHLRDPFEVEQEVTLLLGRVLGQALEGSSAVAPQCAPAQRELVERTREVLAGDPFARSTVRELAARVGTSPFHLCRVFRRATGFTLHHYRLELRTRHALELVEQGASLSRLACRLGFSSHSHFSAEFRRRLGAAPSRVRSALRAVALTGEAGVSAEGAASVPLPAGTMESVRPSNPVIAGPGR